MPAEAHDEGQEVLAGALWSDPVNKEGVSASSRGIGVFFGPDVTKSFLGRHYTLDENYSTLKTGV